MYSLNTIGNYSRQALYKISMNPNNDIIEAMLTPEKVKINTTKQKIADIEKKIEAFGKLNEASLNLLSSVNSINNSYESSFTVNTDEFLTVTSVQNAKENRYIIDVIRKGQLIENATQTTEVSDIHESLGLSVKIQDYSREYEITIVPEDSLYVIAQKLNTLPNKGTSDESYKEIDPYKGEVAFIDGNKLIINEEDSILNLKRFKNALNGVGIGVSEGRHLTSSLVKVNGVIHSSNTNSFKVDGLEFDINEVGNGTEILINRNLNTEVTFEIIKEVVNNLNDFSKMLYEFSSFSSYEERGVLNGDSTVSFLKRKLGALNRINISDNNNMNFLFTIGITIDRHGTISLNERKFKNELSQNPNEVEQLLLRGYGDRNVALEQSGLFANIKYFSDALSVGHESIFTVKMGTLQDNSKKVKNDLEKYEKTLEKRREMLTKQFIATQSIMNQMDVQSSYLSQLEF